IQKCLDLLQRMDNAPYEFVLRHQETDLKAIVGFKHRTFNDTDALYFIAFLQHHYQRFNSLEDAFVQFMSPKDITVEKGLVGFQRYFTSLPYFPKRTGKHLASPAMGSACKRLNMFLRWMVRKDEKGVDLGIWKAITPCQLVFPLDVHVERVARKLHLLRHPQTNWKAALELTDFFRKISPEDPVQYDFALFGLGLEGFAD
ncbi:MAG: TIGR02757 family protein, partial [Flammeovirgaceae bacterium]|nr:TIGR02757 family protein [Flammeovirgaceae bacterium]MDW8288592.1 TIGR02757 family protein [Flammeovirgaceae bacterium]